MAGENWLQSNGDFGIGIIEDVCCPEWATLPSVCQMFTSEPVSQKKACISKSEGRYLWSFDVLGAIFFLISRYEEAVSDVRDIHGRFPLKESVLFEGRFHLRPLVNEYVELLKELIQICSPNVVFREHVYQQFISCDVDYLTSPR